MTAPFNDSELTQIDQPDDLNDSGFDGPWNQDFESTYPFLSTFDFQKTNKPFGSWKNQEKLQDISKLFDTFTKQLDTQVHTLNFMLFYIYSL